MIELIAAYVSLTSDCLGREQLSDRTVLALTKVPRHDYVPDELQEYAYTDNPLPIGCGKTISQPFIVAIMTELLQVDSDDAVLEVGTGLGYQAAILAELADKVYSVEIMEELADGADVRLDRAGYDNVKLRLGDGSQGWLDHGPFDRIIVTAAPELIPPALIRQLKPGGRMVIPAGLEDQQQLIVVEKDLDDSVQTREIMPVLFSRLITAH